MAGLTMGAPECRACPSAPTVSIIIPCRNEARYISRCLDSLCGGLSDSKRVEIVVMDGMSTDGTREIVAGYCADHPNIRMIDNPSGTKSDALNLGVSLTRSDVVMRIDAHAIYAPDYVEKLVDGLFRYAADNIGGVRDTHAGPGLVEEAVAAVVSHPFAAGNARWRTGAIGVRRVDTVFCGCYRRDVFRRIGPFNPYLVRAQDREFNARLRAAGGIIVLDPGVRCTYFPRAGLRAYWRWTFEGAFWLYYARRFTATPMIASRNVAPLVFVGYHLLPSALVFTGSPLAIAAVVPLAAYWLLAAAVASRVAARRSRPTLMPVLTLLFAMTHFGYGIGGWMGLLKAFALGRLRKKT